MIDKIKRCLRGRQMTIEEVANAMDVSRATASKYLLAMELTKQVNCRVVGRAKLFSLK
ncbi:MAG TPA: hypothetical protein VJI12_01215 [archaeon]|nr:hypothetical protein [archaeon]